MHTSSIQLLTSQTSRTSRTVWGPLGHFQLPYATLLLNGPGPAARGLNIVASIWRFDIGLVQ